MSKSFEKVLSNTVQNNLFDFFKEYSTSHENIDYDDLIASWTKFEVSESVPAAKKKKEPKVKAEKKPVDESLLCTGTTKVGEPCKGRRIKDGNSTLCSIHFRSEGMNTKTLDTIIESESEVEGETQTSYKFINSEKTPEPEKKKTLKKT
jgi:hypothetical protein